MAFEGEFRLDTVPLDAHRNVTRKDKTGRALFGGAICQEWPQPDAHPNDLGDQSFMGFDIRRYHRSVGESLKSRAITVTEILQNYRPQTNTASVSAISFQHQDSSWDGQVKAAPLMGSLILGLGSLIGSKNSLFVCVGNLPVTHLNDVAFNGIF